MISNAKPRPCVGCGYCCRKARCVAGQSLELAATGKVSNIKDCPWLVWNGEKYRCLAYINEEARKALAIGEGCCCPLNTDRRNVMKR